MTDSEWELYLNTLKDTYKDPEYLGNKVNGNKTDFFKADVIASKLSIKA